MTDPSVRYDVSNNIARIILDRPPVNALDLDMIRSVVVALETAAKDDAVRAVVLTSAVPNRFCVIPAIHFAHLPRIVGRHRAFELLFSGRSFDAEEAHRLGLVSRLAPDGEVEVAALALAETFAAKSPVIMRLGRAAFMRQNDLDYRRSIANAVEDFCNVTMTDAAQEGLRVFSEKRARRD
jgi:enoyl-CoA hydratase/carnithine racemase